MGNPVSLEDLKKRGLILSILKNKETHEQVCMCYKEQCEAVALLFLGKNWGDKYMIENSPPAIILADTQVLLAMAPVMQVEMPAMAKMRPGGGMGGGGMFGGGRPPGRSMFGGSGQSEDEDEDENEDEDEDESEDEDGDPDDAKTG